MTDQSRFQRNYALQPEPNSSNDSRESPKPIFVAVMGATGSGKSSFINLVGGLNLATSDLLGSCTQDVQAAPEFQLDGRKITLIDTPGFDDTDRSEVHILQLIAGFLADQYRNGIKLNGIIYLHRISDIRMGGVSIRTLKVFRELCGSNFLKNVTIVTNRWSRGISVEEQKREQQLRDDERFFKPFLDGQATMRRHDNTAESARTIIREICNKEPVLLDIQLEIVDQSKLLRDTSAGKALNRALEELVRGLGSEAQNLRDGVDEAVRQGDGSTKAELESVLRQSEAQLTRIQNEVKNLQARRADEVDAGRRWRRMSQGVKIATLFRRSQGAMETSEVDNFWLALGDTIKLVKEVRTIFDEHPMPLTLRRQLLEDNYGNPPDLERWVRRNRDAVTEMETLVETAIRTSASGKPKRQVRLWRVLVRRFTMAHNVGRVPQAT